MKDYKELYNNLLNEFYELKAERKEDIEELLTDLEYLCDMDNSTQRKIKEKWEQKSK